MTIAQLISEVLQEKMIEKGFKTLTAFAEASGVSQSYLSKIFNKEKPAEVSPSVLAKLVIPLEMTLSQFFEAVEKKKLMFV